MKYSIEISKIIEGALKRDQIKVFNYTKQLIEKLEIDNDLRAANKLKNILVSNNKTLLSPMNFKQEPDMPVDNESRTKLADIIYPTENNIEVILSKSNLDKLNSFILSYKNADKLTSMGIDMPNTLMLYGPPGCGKTKSAYLIARELHLPLIIARLDSIISSYLGTTAKNIRTLFEFTQKTPCVLFLDEFDAIAKARDDNNELGELKRVVNSLIQNIDSMSNDSLLLAATNHDKLLDSAVWRRFDYKLEIELPDIESIKKMIDLFSNKAIVFSDKDKEELASVFFGLSGANIEEIIKKSLVDSIIHNNKFSKINIFEEYFSFKKILPQDLKDKKAELKIKANFLRSCNKRVFSYSSIAEILNTSKTSVSKLITVEEVKNE